MSDPNDWPYMPARDDELAEDCREIDQAWDRALRAEFGVAASEKLMIAVYLPEDDDVTPEQEAAMIARRLQQPVAVVDHDDGSVLAFARPPKAS